MKRRRLSTSNELHRPPRVGDRLGPYRLCFEIARGGMATVYLARIDGRAGLHRFVALKCIKPELAQSPTFTEMFFDEAQIASQIHHANVCSVLDFDEHRGVYVLAMEYLCGETVTSIERLLAEQPPPSKPTHRAGLVARIIADAAEGLHAAHELKSAQGQPLEVVHRDVSPDNLFVTYDGNVKIVDFGVARAADQRHKTRTGVVKGKYSYIAPEILQGEKPDRRADIWGLGVIAWELCTGRRLFAEKNNVETLRSISEKEIPPPSKLQQGIPRAFDDIVLKALAREPDDRYATARDFGREMNRFLAKQKLAIGLAELSDFVNELFPAGRERKRQILEIAGQLEDCTPFEREEKTTPYKNGELSDGIPIHTGTLYGPEMDSTPTHGGPTPCAGTNPRRLPLSPTLAQGLVLFALLASLLTIAALLWRGTSSGEEQARPTQHAPAPASNYRLEVNPMPAATPGAVLLQVRLVGDEGPPPAAEGAGGP